MTNMPNVKKLKQKCLSLGQRGSLATRQLEKLNTETEILSFCIRRRLVVPGITPTTVTFRPINQYAVSRHPEIPIMMDARRFSNDPAIHPLDHRLSVASISSSNVPSTPFNQPPTTSRAAAVPQFSRSQKIDEIQELIAKEIGRKWKPLGRALQFTEGFLDELEDRHPRNLQEKVIDMVTALQQQCKLEDELIERMKTALKTVGRNDLVRQVENL